MPTTEPLATLTPPAKPLASIAITPPLLVVKFKVVPLTEPLVIVVSLSIARLAASISKDVESFIVSVMILPFKVALETNLFSSTPNVVTSDVNDVPSFSPSVKSSPIKEKEFTNLSTEANPAVLVNMAFNCTTA